MESIFSVTDQAAAPESNVPFHEMTNAELLTLVVPGEDHDETHPFETTPGAIEEMNLRGFSGTATLGIYTDSFPNRYGKHETVAALLASRDIKA